MKIALFYFSGTGNTEMAVKQCAASFAQNGAECALIKVEEGFEGDIADYDLIGIGYPVHAFNAPPIILQFVKNLPKLDKPKRLFIIKTSGEPLALNNASSLKIASILKKKNYILNNEYHYVMPYNMIFRHSDAAAYKMWNTAKRLIPIDCAEILSGKKVLLKKPFMGRFIAWAFRIEHWGGRFNGKKYKVSEKCIHCMKCVNTCPVKNIEYADGKFKFKGDCIMCMRCSFGCPVDAIKIGWFNGWKVNGKYDFENPEGTYQASHKNFCKRAYAKYYARSEKKIEENS